MERLEVWARCKGWSFARRAAQTLASGVETSSKPIERRTLYGISRTNSRK